jgi:hypothetical protein
MDKSCFWYDIEDRIKRCTLYQIPFVDIMVAKSIEQSSTKYFMNFLYIVKAITFFEISTCKKMDSGIL